MTRIDRRRFLALTAASLGLPPAIERAWAIQAKVVTGTIADVQHVVILMQENRSFDHYFGTMSGVRGFGDRFPIPLPGGRTVWSQASTKDGLPLIAPFPLNTAQTFAHMRVQGTPHNWADAQFAWDEGRMGGWPDSKGAHTMAHYVEADIPFQFALANAFTICDAYYGSFVGGTNTNRLFLWTGTNDPGGKFGGPSLSNSHDTLPEKGGPEEPYTWTTFPERLEKAGVSWKIYEDMADTFGDNPLVGFKVFRDSLAKAPGSNPRLAEKGLTTQHLDALRSDVQADRLPQVSWIVSPAKDSEHPGPSSPAQGADYTARVLDCLTSNPDVWARTVLLVMFDENDGFFDHMPPPAPPSRLAEGGTIGASTASLLGEYHRVRNPIEAKADRDELVGRPYGLGARVPAYVISPWSRGGWVNSEVFDHTSVIRFLETRFKVMEPNISPWRRAVCGDLTSCFDFKTPNEALPPKLPETAATARRAAAMLAPTRPPTPDTPTAPVQASGSRPSRPLPYLLSVEQADTRQLKLRFVNLGRAGAVFHVYDRKRLDRTPRRYTVEAGKTLEDGWPSGAFDVCVYGPNGFCRRFAGSGARPGVQVAFPDLTPGRPQIRISVRGPNGANDWVTVRPAAYADKMKLWNFQLDPADPARIFTQTWPLEVTHGWYDFELTRAADPAWRVRLAGRVDTGAPSYSDPAMGGPAVMTLDT